MVEEPKSTVKIQAAPAMNEREYAQYLYDEALKKMIANPTKANIDAFTAANVHLFEVEDLYRIAARLLLERARRVRDAIRHVLVH